MIAFRARLAKATRRVDRLVLDVSVVRATPIASRRRGTVCPRPTTKTDRPKWRSGRAGEPQAHGFEALRRATDGVSRYGSFEVELGGLHAGLYLAFCL